jgi:polar amino acid transport system substrate-binding protein
MVRIFLGLWLLAGAAGAQTLRVYTKPIEPFAFQKDGKPDGFSLELWERVAQQAGLKYQLTWVKTMPELMEALKSGQADVGVAAISITSDREKLIDFSQPYYESGLQILVEGGNNSSTAALVGTLLNWNFVRLLAVLAAALLVSSHLLWWFEHRHNESDFPADYKHGVWESLWWTSSVLITGGCENKAPAGVGGRLVAVIWMLTGILLVSVLTASVTSAMTVRSLTSDINGPADLPGHVTGTIAGSTAERYLADRHVEFRSFPSVDEAVAALSAKNVQAVVYDAPVLLYRAAKGGGGQARVVGRLFEKQNYGIALQQGSKLRKPINQILLELGEQGYLGELRRKYFGDSD